MSCISDVPRCPALIKWQMIWPKHRPLDHFHVKEPGVDPILNGPCNCPKPDRPGVVSVNAVYQPQVSIAAQNLPYTAAERLRDLLDLTRGQELTDGEARHLQYKPRKSGGRLVYQLVQVGSNGAARRLEPQI